MYKHQRRLTPEQQNRVTANLPLVYSTVRLLRLEKRWRSVAIAGGMLGLIEAVLTWKPGKWAFSTVATRCIRNEAYSAVNLDRKGKRDYYAAVPKHLVIRDDYPDWRDRFVVVDWRDTLEWLAVQVGDKWNRLSQLHEENGADAGRRAGVTREAIYELRRRVRANFGHLVEG